MLFSKKNKGFFVEVSEHAILLARTSSPQVPFEIEEMQECPPKDPVALAEAIKRLQAKKNTSGYLRATVGTYPSKRLVRRHALEPKRVKESGYFSELLTQQFRIDEEKYTVAVLNATDGSDYDVGNAAQKDVVFAGMLNEEVNALQDTLLEMGVYPERLELGSISTLGGVVDYLAFTKSRTPTLVLEIGADATQSFIVSASGIEASRPIPQGLDSMLAVVQKELGLKDEDSAKRLFHLNTFDFTGMGPMLIKRLLKELQSSIGFYEVQTGQSVGQIVITQLSPKQKWIETAIAASLGIAILKPDTVAWLQSRQITASTESLAKNAADVRWFGLLSLMVQHTSTAHAAAEEKSEANAPEVPSWHPNFRNFQRLPDTKVVRTAFFINVVAITVSLVLLLFVASREWELYTLKQQVAEKQEQIDQNKSGSDQAVALFKKYQAEEAKLTEVQSFVESKLVLSDLLVHLGQTLPKNMAFDRFDLRDTGLIIGATIRGAQDQASSQATAYIEQLRADQKVTARFDEIKPVNTERNAATGRITIEISMRLKVVTPKGGKK